MAKSVIPEVEEKRQKRRKEPSVADNLGDLALYGPLGAAAKNLYARFSDPVDDLGPNMTAATGKRLEEGSPLARVGNALKTGVVQGLMTPAELAMAGASMLPKTPSYPYGGMTKRLMSSLVDEGLLKDNYTAPPSKQQGAAESAANWAGAGLLGGGSFRAVANSFPSIAARSGGLSQFTSSVPQRMINSARFDVAPMAVAGATIPYTEGLVGRPGAEIGAGLLPLVAGVGGSLLKGAKFMPGHTGAKTETELRNIINTYKGDPVAMQKIIAEAKALGITLPPVATLGGEGQQIVRQADAAARALSNPVGKKNLLEANQRNAAAMGSTLQRDVSTTLPGEAEKAAGQMTEAARAAAEVPRDVATRDFAKYIMSMVDTGSAKVAEGYESAAKGTIPVSELRKAVEEIKTFSGENRIAGDYLPALIVDAEKLLQKYDRGQVNPLLMGKVETNATVPAMDVAQLYKNANRDYRTASPAERILIQQWKSLTGDALAANPLASETFKEATAKAKEFAEIVKKPLGGGSSIATVLARPDAENALVDQMRKVLSGEGGADTGRRFNRMAELYGDKEKLQEKAFEALRDQAGQKAFTLIPGQSFDAAGKVNNVFATTTDFWRTIGIPESKVAKEVSRVQNEVEAAKPAFDLYKQIAENPQGAFKSLMSLSPEEQARAAKYLDDLVKINPANKEAIQNSIAEGLRSNYTPMGGSFNYKAAGDALKNSPLAETLPYELRSKFESMSNAQKMLDDATAFAMVNPENLGGKGETALANLAALGVGSVGGVSPGVGYRAVKGAEGLSRFVPGAEERRYLGASFLTDPDAFTAALKAYPLAGQSETYRRLPGAIMGGIMTQQQGIGGEQFSSPKLPEPVVPPEELEKQKQFRLNTMNPTLHPDTFKDVSPEEEQPNVPTKGSMGYIDPKTFED